MKKIISYQILIAVFAVLFSCGKDSSCFKSTGKIITEQRSVSADVIIITTSDKINIVFTQSNTASLSVEGGENLLPYINTDVSGTELTISSDNKCTMFRDYDIPITVYLSLPNLSRINYSGQGTITNTNTLNTNDFGFDSRGGTGSIKLAVNANNLSVWQHSGPADFTFTGVANTSYLYTLGNGWFYLSNYITKSTHIVHNGSGDITVNATDNLVIELKSTGNLNYHSSPILNVPIHTGSGQIIKK